ncbi:MAG: hypothetical protein MJY78_10895 [Fibrobacter sp.]|nr:hypothetical protein [Fibrobacter sp.]
MIAPLNVFELRSKVAAARKCQNKFCHFSRLANFYIFKEYKKLPDTHPLKKYLKYFATNAADSVETKEIDSKVEWYKTDGLTQERYMTWEQEIQLAVENERQRNEKVIAEKDQTIAEKDREIAELKAKLAAK